MKSKDDKNLLEAYNAVSKLQTEADTSPLKKLHMPWREQPKNTEDATKQKEYNEDLAEWIKNRISRELPQDLDVREDLVKLYKKLSANQLGKEITNTNTGNEEEPDKNLSRAQFAMSGYNGPKS